MTPFSVPMTARFVVAGATTAWTEVGSLLDSLNDGDWTLTMTATRYELEEVKRSSVERAVVRMVVTPADKISVQALYRMRSAEQRLEIVGTNGTLRWDNADGVLHFHKMPAEFGTYGPNPPPAEMESFLPPAGFERNLLFITQTRHFIEVVRGTEKPVCTLEDGIQAMRMAWSAMESQAAGRVITLSPA